MTVHERTIVNADDLGISDTVNEAIFDAFDRGIVSSATMLANGPSVISACEGARRRPTLGVGIHMNTSEFVPMTERFATFRNAEPTVDLRTTRRLSRQQRRSIGNEWIAQIEHIRSLGIEPTHLDSHHFDHVNPILFGQLRRVSRATGIHRVRGMRNLAAEPWSPLVNGAKAGHRRAMSLAGMTTTRYMTDATTWLELLAAGRLPSDGICEVMCHPGHPGYAEETDALLTCDIFAHQPISWASVR